MDTNIEIKYLKKNMLFSKEAYKTPPSSPCTDKKIEENSPNSSNEIQEGSGGKLQIYEERLPNI
jgi:hypothetical protein